MADVNACAPACRTCHQCYWLGVDRTRWARNVYSAGLGREYKAPCVAIPESHWKGRIAAVCEAPLCMPFC